MSVIGGYMQPIKKGIRVKLEYLGTAQQVAPGDSMFCDSVRHLDFTIEEFSGAALSVQKRVFDVLVSLLAIMLLVPLLAMVAIAVKLDGPGPIFFMQRRTGLGGRAFNVMKFRTMRVLENGNEVRHALRKDERVTTIGAFLRRSSIDELPQLINVLLGDMSLVGPRPHAIAHDNLYGTLLPHYRWRFRARPGLTGLAQVRGQRGGISTLACMEGRVASDREYIEQWSWWLDMSIMLRTLPRLITDKAAY